MSQHYFLKMPYVETCYPHFWPGTRRLRLTDCHQTSKQTLGNEDDKGQQRVSEMGEGKEWSRWLGTVSMKVEKAGFEASEVRAEWLEGSTGILWVLLQFEMIDLSFKSDSSPGVEVQR